jgi:hypothetical protein
MEVRWSPPAAEDLERRGLQVAFFKLEAQNGSGYQPAFWASA